ncbi:MAG: CBS domain-containing protein [Rhodospirillales bacterium]
MEPTCGSLMSTQPVTVAPADPVSAALALLLKHRQLALPVVDADGTYRGMFLRSLLLMHLLPRITQMEEQLDNVSRIVEAMAASETVETLQARYRELAGEPVARFSDAAGPVLNPETPLMHTVHLLHRSRTILPVVDEKTNKLVGVVSAWDLLSRLSGQS